MENFFPNTLFHMFIRIDQSGPLYLLPFHSGTQLFGIFVTKTTNRGTSVCIDFLLCSSRVICFTKTIKMVHLNINEARNLRFHEGTSQPLSKRELLTHFE